VSGVGGRPPDEVERVRLFVALELPDPVRSALVAWRDHALRHDRGVRPLEVDSLHVTLCFLGWRDAGEIDAIAAACGAVAVEPAVTLVVGTPRWLPPRRPRVLAVELLDRGGGLTRAQALLAQVLEAGGWYQPEKRPYLPHVTVARAAKDGRPPRDALPPPTPTEFHGSRVTLYRSRLLRSGARYDALATIELRTAR
jgi:RNA 2',3'-cyclic 3'-phosphodiesterase